jgi:YVTN family beta-propeller protein
LLVADPINKKVLNKIPVGEQPHSVILNKDESKAYVSNQWSDNISVIDLKLERVIDTLKTANGPAGMALSRDEKTLYAANTFSNKISVIDLTTGEERRLDSGNNPTGVKASPDGKSIYVTSRRNQVASYGEPVRTELTVLDDSTKRIREYKTMKSAHLIENVAFTCSGDLALMTLVRPKNFVPSIQVERGFIMNYGIGIVEQKPNGRTIQLLIDEPNQYYPDPFGIVVSPDGKRAFVSSSGVNCLSVINLDSVRSLINRSTPEMMERFSNNLGISRNYMEKRIFIGADPKGMSLTSDGKLLYVAEQLEDKIAVISTETYKKVSEIDLGGPRKVTVARHGKRLFASASHTFQDQFSCYTCHPDYHEDGLIYNMAAKGMGRNLANTESRDISETAPFKWTGINPSVFKQDGIRFSTVLTRTEPFTYEELDAISSFIMTDIPYPPNLENHSTEELTEMQLRGKAIFERTKDKHGKIIPVENRCVTCHPAPYYTNRKMSDVGTLAATDDPTKFDTTHLNNIYASSPYLHDGRATTLEEIWTKYNPDDKHGVANDLSKMELNELIEYLKSLSSPDYDKKLKNHTH